MSELKAVAPIGLSDTEEVVKLLEQGVAIAREKGYTRVGIFSGDGDELMAAYHCRDHDALVGAIEGLKLRILRR